MKRVKLFSLISLMIFTLSVIAVGVYAANVADESMGVGGTINIPSNLIDVEVLGYIGDATTTVKYNSTTDSDQKWQLTKGELIFLSEEAENVSAVEPIVLTFALTNNSDLNLRAYFTENGTKKTSSYIGGTETEPTITVAFGDGNIVKSGGKLTLTITFDLQKLVEEEQDFGFNYSLIIEEEQSI